ncbi:MAG: DUF420 domain-containing protein [Planctomycetaceae bacterium]|nr:DUF420 domain-containing protein [Planctomycetaceae bacterium]
MSNALLMAAFQVKDLPAVNAALNALATVLLVVGYVLIKQRREQAHKRTMLAAFGVSVVFLVCYLIYHRYAGHVRFGGPSPVREVYYALLLTHVLLAATVPFLAVATIYQGLADNRPAHRRLARWTFPIWLYVSITGVVIYAMLYHLYPPVTEQPTMNASGAAAPASTPEV